MNGRPATKARYVAILTQDEAEYVLAKVRPPGRATIEEPPEWSPKWVHGLRGLTIDETAYQFMRNLPHDADGHVDTLGHLWMGREDVATFRPVTA